MGNTHSPSTDPRFTTASRAFSQREFQDLKTLFTSLASQSQSDGQYISPSVFQTFFQINGPLGQRMFDLITQKRNDQRLTFEDIVIAKGIYEKGTRDEIEKFIYQLLDVTGDGIVGRSDLEAVLTAIFDAIFSQKMAGIGVSSHQDIEPFLNAAKFSKKIEGSDENSMTFEDYKNWCSLVPSIRKFLGSLLTPPDQGRLGSQVPRLLHPEHIDPGALVLRKEYAWHIGGTLSQHELEEWKLLYHSAFNGLSFNTFLGSISYLGASAPSMTVNPMKDIIRYLGASAPSMTVNPMKDNLCSTHQYFLVVARSLFILGLHALLVSWLFTSQGTYKIPFSTAEGPTVLIIKDKEGYIYGGYASQPWEKHGDFYGDLKCFIFQLYPRASIFRPTGANNNLQWCAVNFSSESIPNGLGFGGKVNHFGLFLSANFDQGQTFTCTTFGSPCLSKESRIYPEVIECWGVVLKDQQQESSDKVRASVLERFKEDRNMLKMVGIANASE